jgi:hypothetical protein
MPRAVPSLTEQQAHMQLLITEAALQREQLQADLNELNRNLSRVARQARSFGSIASTAALLLASVSGFRARNNGVAKASLGSRLLSGARLATSFWLALRSRPK